MSSSYIISAGARVDLDDHFKTTLGQDVASLIIGDHVATGTFRDVYQHAFFRDQVIKLENVAGSFCNATEWMIWNAVKDKPSLARWFAPCLSISVSGVALVMRRTSEVRDGELPKRIPSFFADLKADNWGMLDGRAVCHDYGNNFTLENGLTSSTIKAEWR